MERKGKCRTDIALVVLFRVVAAIVLALGALVVVAMEPEGELRDAARALLVSLFRWLAHLEQAFQSLL